MNEDGNLKSNKTRMKYLLGGRHPSIGPITRMQLWSRFEPTPTRYWIIFLTCKLVLLASIAYYLFG